MAVYIYTIIFLILFLYSVKKDKRRLRNGAFLLCVAIGVVGIFSEIISKTFNSEALTVGVLLAIPVSMIGTSIFLVINFFIMIKKEGFKKSSLVPLLFAGLIVFSMASVILSASSIKATLFSRIVHYPWILVNGIVIYSGFAFIGFLAYTITYRALPKELDVDFIIIHGAGLMGDKVTPLLAKRIDKAVEVYHKGQEKASFVVSGGKGSDEIISEAEAMKKYLLEKGISQNKIITENKSRTTFENLKFSKKIMDKIKGINNYKCVFVTNDYHVLRTGSFASEIGLDAEGIGCKTAFYYLPSGFIREFIAVMVKYKKPYYAITAIWLVGLIMSIL